MSEIEKLYENAGVKKIIPTICSNNELDCKGCKAYIENAMPYCKNAEYPRFTAEKQLELIKLIANRKGYPDYEYFGNLFDDYIQLLDFNEALAKLVNLIWQDITEEEKEQIRTILES